MECCFFSSRRRHTGSLCDWSADVCSSDLAYRHQEVPFERLVSELVVGGGLGHSPLFQVMFFFQEFKLPEVSLEEIRLEPLEHDSGTAKFDLLLELGDTGEGLRGTLEYSRDVLDEARGEGGGGGGGGGGGRRGGGALVAVGGGMAGAGGGGGWWGSSELRRAGVAG